MMTVESMLAHAKGALGEGRIEGRIHDALPHYLWMWGRGEEKSGVCSHCHSVLNGREALIPERMDVYTDPYIDYMAMDPFWHPNYYKKVNLAMRECRAMHGNVGFCPRCGELVTYRDMSRGHSGLYDRILYLDVTKSAIDQNTLVQVWWEVTACWDKQLHPDMGAYEIVPDIEMLAAVVCVFQFGKGAWRMVWDKREQRWKMRTKCHSGYLPFGYCFPYSGSCVPHIMHCEDYAEALEDTTFAAFDTDDHSVSRTDRLALIAKTPCLEYLQKLGMERLVEFVLTNPSPSHLLNLRGKTAAKVLRISPEQWGWCKGTGHLPDVAALKTFQTAAGLHLRIGNEKLWAYSRLWPAEALKEMHAFFGDGLMKKAVNYILRTKPRMLDWLDHLQMMKQMGLPPTEEAIAFPRDFEAMHARISGQVQIRVDKDKQKMLDQWLDSIRDCNFSAMGLVMRPLATIGDVVKEGKQQHHCVGTYAERYAEGRTILCTLREENAMHQPLYTVELKRDRSLVQCRGPRNQEVPGYRERLDLFWKLFEMMQRERKKQVLLAAA